MRYICQYNNPPKTASGNTSILHVAKLLNQLLQSAGLIS